MLDYYVIYITLLIVSLIYLAIGFLVNKQNASYLIAGYNIMGKEQRSKFDIDRYLIFFKSFFKKLAFFPWISWFICAFLFDFSFSIIIWSILQILPFIWFIRQSFAFK